MYHYIRLKISPPCSDILTIRKTTADALSQTFGLSAEATQVDILLVTDDGTECVLRARPNDAPRILTSLISWNENRQFSLVRESSFLPSLLVEPIV